MPPGIKFEQKVPPKKRVIATKLNLRQKCVFQLFYRFSLSFIVFLCFPSFFIVFQCFSSFFNVFIVLLCFSSFFIIPNLFPFRNETVTSDHFSWNQTTSAEISIIYSTKLCMFNTRSLLFVFWKLCLSAFSHIKILRAAANETCVLQVNFVVFWGGTF